MNELKEYIVTLHKHEDLDNFYQDMETSGGNLYIPNREIDIVNRRPISRNTHYLLTDEEASQISQDSRVLAVSPPLHTFTDLVSNFSSTQTAKFDASFSPDTNSKNWGLLFGTSESINSSLQNFNAVTTTIPRKLSGKNVDVVSPEGVIKKNHAEFAVNIDGTGGYRTIEADWYSYGLGSPPSITPPPGGIYVYDYSYIADHATHVTGTIAGNTQGWARDASIYFSVPSYSASPYQGSWDYIRAWHNWKKINQINSNLGRHNPTVVGLSTNIRGIINISSITSITYRGTTYAGTWTNASPSTNPAGWSNGTVTLAALGFRQQQIRNQEGAWKVFVGPGISVFAAENADIADAISDGVIIVQSAGNYGMKVDVSGGLDYNNSVTASGTTYHQNRNEWTADVIAAGNLTPDLYNADFASGDTGPAVTLFSPGTRIVSSIPNSYTDNDSFLDPRGLNGDLLAGITWTGTSMACPQIAGVIACLLELKPSFNQSDVKAYLLNVAKSFKVDGGFGDTTKTLFLPEPTFAISANKNSVASGESIVYTITTTNVPDGSVIYLTESGTSTGTDFVDGLTQQVITINNNTASYTRTVSTGA
jgi:hypothetical protein